MIYVILFMWFLYLVSSMPAGFLIALLGRRRADWRIWELCIFVVPFAAWILPHFLFPAATSKGIIQPFYEVFLLGMGVPILAGIRVLVGRKYPAWPLSVIMITVLSAVGIGVTTLVPRVMPVD